MVRATRSSRRSLLIERTARTFDLRAEQALALLETVQGPSFRTNPLRGVAPGPAGLDALAERLPAGPIEPYPWIAEGFAYGAATHELSASAAHESGEVFIQNPSSFLPVLALDVQPGHHVLDMFAAPGGKLAHAAARAGGQASFVANDRSRPRLAKLREVLALLGVEHVELRADHAEHLGTLLGDQRFDRVLVDAQCTGEALLDLRRPDEPRAWSLDRVERFSYLQRKALRVGYGLLRPGGVLVYSTCTYAPEENELPVDRLLRHTSALLEPFEVPGVSCRTLPGRTDWAGERFASELGHTLRVLPDERFEGFFVARIVKPPDATD